MKTAFFLAVASILIIGLGCVSSNRTRILIGDSITMPEVLPSESTLLSIRLFQTVNGLSLSAPSNHSVRISYSASSTNHYLGLIDKQTSSKADVVVSSGGQ